LNIAFDDASDVVGAAVGLDGVTAVGLLVIPKLNFGFDASLAGTVLALGLETLLAVVAGLEGCGNEKKFCGAALKPFPCGADEACEMELVDGGAFTGAKEKIEAFADPFASGTEEGVVVGCVFCVKKLETVGLDKPGPVAAGIDVELKLGMVGLDGVGALAAGVDVEVCIAGIGAAEGKENKVGGAAAAVLPSDLSFASLSCEFEGSVGILNKGGLEGSAACKLPFENEGREKVDVAVGGVTEGFSSDFAGKTAGKVGTVAVAAFFASASLASASAFALSFSSALRRRRAIASASISCFSHFE
jgi:hypothetical protein